MIFKFLKYLQPTHYFVLNDSSGKSVFPIVADAPIMLQNQLAHDERYVSDAAKAYDLSWQAIHKGYIGEATTYTSFDCVPLRDNYLFARKYFNNVWVFYILLLRILSFHNPFKEIYAWYKTRDVKRYHYEDQPLVYPNWDQFTGTLIPTEPLVSVIIPTLNRYDFLYQVLRDFEQQDYKHFEIIVVDQSDQFEEAFYQQFDLKIVLIRQQEKALWLARNNAVKKASGAFIALSEDDVRIDANWISQHLRCLDFFKADVSAGVFFPEGQSIPKTRSYFSRASQFATGNAMLKREVFRKVGLFDRQFEKQRMGDGEFGLRCYLQGLKCVSNPCAYCVDVKAATGGLREHGSWDAFRPSNFLAPRPIPSVIYFYRSYFGNKATRRALLRTVPISLFSYKLKRNKLFLLLAGLLSLLLLPLVCIQVYRSWRLASKKIQQGPLIEPYIDVVK